MGPEVDLTEVRTRAGTKIQFDKTKAKIDKYSVGDLVLLPNEKLNQTKLNLEYKAPKKLLKYQRVMSMFELEKTECYYIQLNEIEQSFIEYE